MQVGNSFEQDRVRLGRDGLPVGDRKIADYAQVVETIPPELVEEIRGPVVARGSVVGTIIGGWLGFCVGVVPGLGGVDAGLARASLAGAVTVGGWLGHRWSNHSVEGWCIDGVDRYRAHAAQQWLGAGRCLGGRAEADAHAGPHPLDAVRGSGDLGN